MPVWGARRVREPWELVHLCPADPATGRVCHIWHPLDTRTPVQVRQSGYTGGNLAHLQSEFAVTTTTDLMRPAHGHLHKRGRVICDRNASGNGWYCYGNGRLIQWDHRGADGSAFPQNHHTPHYTVTDRYGTTPKAVSSARPFFDRTFIAPFEVTGWAQVTKEPTSGNNGFKVSFLHEGNMENWLFQALRGNRTTNLFRENRLSPDYDPVKAPYGKSYGGGSFNWKVGKVYRWKVDVSDAGRQIDCYVGDLETPIISKEVPAHARILSGQVGFRLDGAEVHFGSVVVREH